MTPTEKIRKLAATGLTKNQISQELGCHKGKVRQSLYRNKPHRTTLKEQILTLRVQGKSYKEIEKLLDCSKSTIHYHCKKLLTNDEIKNTNKKTKRASLPKIPRSIEINEEDLKKFVKESFSLTEVSQKLGFEKGRRLSALKKKIASLQLDVSHFLGKKVFQSIKKTDSIGSYRCIKRRILKQRGRRCENCGLSEWQKQPIPIHLHHLNENHADNREENLQLLCANCHGLKHS